MKVGIGAAIFVGLLAVTAATAQAQGGLLDPEQLWRKKLLRKQRYDVGLLDPEQLRWEQLLRKQRYNVGLFNAEQFWRKQLLRQQRVEYGEFERQ